MRQKRKSSAALKLRRKRSKIMQRNNLTPLKPEEIYHRVLGTATDKTPIVFLHGLMGFAANWGKIWPHFERERNILVLDQRGHGKSAKPLTGYSPYHYAADLKNLLEQIGWKRAHIVGHSMGGRVALIFAKEYLHHTASLTMEDSGAEANPSRIQWIKNLLGNIPTPFSDRAEAKKFFSTHFSYDPMTGGFLFANLETKNNGTLDWRFHAPGMIETVETGRAVDSMEILRSLETPILLVRGSRSIEFPADEAGRMAQSNKNATLVSIEGAGHYVHAEKPIEFSSALRTFFAQA